MKLFWGSIAFISVACFAPLAFGQNTTTWTLNQPTNGNAFNFAPIVVGNWGTPGNWNNGVPNGAANGSSAVLQVNTYFYFPNNSNALSSNNLLSINVPAGSSAQSVEMQSLFSSALGSGPGTITLNLSGLLTITGISAPQNDAIDMQGGVTGTITGGSLNIQQGNIIVGDFQGTSDALNFVQTSVTVGNNAGMGVGSGLIDTTTGSLTGGEIGSVVQNQASFTTGNNFLLLVGANTGATGSYSLQNGSVLALGSYNAANDTNNRGFTGIVVGSNGSFNVDATSTLNLGTGSQIVISETGGDNTTFNLAGNLNGADTWIYVGNASGLPPTGGVGTFNQTSGNLTGTIGMSLGNGAGSQGIYNFSGGTAAFAQGLFLGAGGGSGAGVVNQSGGSLVVSGGGSTIVGGSGAGTYSLSGGSADFQTGLAIGTGGAQGIFNQTNGTLTAEGTTSIIGTNGAYTISGGAATFTNGLNVTGTLNVNGGVLTTSLGLLGGAGVGTINFGGGTLMLTGATPSEPYAFNYTGSLTSGNSTIDVSQTNLNTFNFTNTLNGNGGIGFVGNGSTVFNYLSHFNSAMTNQYFGTTSITAGTLNALQQDIVNSTGLIMGNGGVLNLSIAPGGLGYAGFVTGTGTLQLNFSPLGSAPTNVVVLPNANGFGGAVVIGGTGTTSGTLQIYNGTFSNVSQGAGVPTGAAGSGVTIGGTPLIGNGVIAVPSTLLPVPIPTTGTVIMPGANSYTGMTTVSPGFTLQAVNFAGSLTNNGTLKTLGSLSTPGSITFGGSLVSTGVIDVIANGTIADHYIVNGAGPSTLSGVVSTVGTGSKTYAVVSTGAGLLSIGGNGNLNDPNGLNNNTNPNLPLYTTFLTEDAAKSTLFVTTVQHPLSTFAQTPAQMAYANAVDPYIQAPSGNLAPLLTILNNTTAAQLPAAIQQLTPQALMYAPAIAFENSTFMVQRLNGALGDMRSGYTGLDLNGISYSAPGFDTGLGRSLGAMMASNAPSFHTTAPNGVNYYPDDGSGAPAVSAPSSDYDQPVHTRMTPSQAATPTTYDTQVISDSPQMKTSAPPSLRTSRFSEFVAGDVILSDINANSYTPNKATYTAGDIMGGVGFRMTSNLTVGVLLDYNHTNAKTDPNGSKTVVDSFTPGVFATFFEKGFYVNGFFGVGLNDYSNSRTLTAFGPLNGTATSSPSGTQYTANLDGGYDFHPAKHWVLGPTLGVTYTHLDINSYTETGVPIDNYKVASQSDDSVRSRFGGHVGYDVQIGNIVIQPNVMAMWQHEFLNTPSGLSASIPGLGVGSFVTPSIPSATDSALMGLGLTATLNNSMGVYLNYMADVSGGDYLAQSIYGGVKASF